jgi:hypothetical protein
MTLTLNCAHTQILHSMSAPAQLSISKEDNASWVYPLIDCLHLIENLDINLNSVTSNENQATIQMTIIRSDRNNFEATLTLDRATHKVTFNFYGNTAETTCVKAFENLTHDEAAHELFKWARIVGGTIVRQRREAEAKKKREEE